MARHKGITKVGRGKYRVRVTATDPRTGKRKEIDRVIAGTIEDALELRLRLREELVAGEPKERQRLGTFARSWLSSRLAGLKPSTASKYATDLQLHIIPALGDFFVDALRPSDVQRFVSEQAERYSGWSVTNRLRLIRTIAKDAVAEGLTDIDFAARVKTPPKKTWTTDEPNLLTAAELGKLLAKVPDPWQAVVLILATTGLRWGEASGLKWEDIDEEAGVIRVRRTNWKGLPVAPKTARSLRDAPLLPEVAAALREHRRRLVPAQNPGLTKGWVFPTSSGDLHRGTPLRKVLERALKKAKIDKHLTTHGLRRTFNDLARRQTSREVVKAITGHATDAMFERYSLVDNEEKKKAAAGVLRLVEMHQSGDRCGDEPS